MCELVEITVIMYVKNDKGTKSDIFPWSVMEPVGPNATLIGPAITGLMLVL